MGLIIKVMMSGWDKSVCALNGLTVNVMMSGGCRGIHVMSVCACCTGMTMNARSIGGENVNCELMC